MRQMSRERYAVFEKEPQKGPIPNGVVLGDYNTKEEAEQARVKYGFISDNFYVDKIIYKPKQRWVKKN